MSIGSIPIPSTIIGGPPPGTVSALAVGPREGRTIFAGARTGLYRTTEVDKGAQTRWQRLPAAPLEIITLALSPNYAEDATLFVGTGQGLFVSRNGGEQWQAALTPMPDPAVLCFCFSPNYRFDGIILAGALEDGVYYSDSRGERWSYRGFGLLDAAVYSLAISPDFAHDETIFAGAESALYYSYNGARAWKALDFPEEAAPVLSLVISPSFAENHTLFAGTEQEGLYRSTDRGASWRKTALPAAAVNALAVAPDDGTLFAATNAGLFCSGDGGERWNLLFDRPDALCLAASDGLLITGLADQGAWLATGRPCAAHERGRGDRADWRPFFTLPARALTGMVLSPRFDSDSTAFLYGPHEGIWRTVDGGRSWASLNEKLPSLDIHSLALSPAFAQNRLLVAAAGEGVLISADGSDHWSLAVETPAALAAFSPSGAWVAIVTRAGEIQVAQGLKGPWRRALFADGAPGQVLALALGDHGRLRAATIDPTGEWVTLWVGEAGRLEQILRRPASPAPIVRFWVHSHSERDAPWYASLDHQVWKVRPSPDGHGGAARLLFETADGGKVVALIGSQTQSRLALFACTGQTLYRSGGAGPWTAIHDFGDERAVALHLSPSYPEDPTAYALLLGGAFCRVNLWSTQLSSD